MSVNLGPDIIQLKKSTVNNLFLVSFWISLVLQISFLINLKMLV